MKTIKLFGEDVEVVEHMKEIEEFCCWVQLFKRWYNRSQFFKAIMGKRIYNGNTAVYEPEDTEFMGTRLGTMGDDRGNACWSIELYDIDTMTAEGLYEVLDEYYNSFFMEGKDGKIYFVAVSID